MEGDTNGEGQSFSEGRFVKILAGGGILPVPSTRGNTKRLMGGDAKLSGGGH